MPRLYTLLLHLLIPLCCFSTDYLSSTDKISLIDNSYRELQYQQQGCCVYQENGRWKEIYVDKPGSLSQQLTEADYDVDSLIVYGTINDVDFYPMWKASFYGSLKVLNLSKATIDNGIVPKNAFWHIDEQLRPDGQYIDCILLRRIILPDGIKSIGYGAFSYAIQLEDINFPSTLQYVDTYAFSDCIKLCKSPLVFPEGMETIGNLTFLNCRSLGEVVLPSTMKKIGDGTFFQSSLSSINLPDGLETIGDAAFYGCKLTEVVIPESCQDLIGTNQFQLNFELKRLHIPEGIEIIPAGFASTCLKLVDLKIPSTIKRIENNAFWQCSSLKTLALPSSLEYVGSESFWHMDSIKQIVFPETLTFLGYESCEYLECLERIYCLSKEPPVCQESKLNIGNSPFGGYDATADFNTHKDIPIYVPIGSAEKYKSAWGWNYFVNFIETDFSTSLCGDRFVESRVPGQKSVTNLNGNRVSTMRPNHIYISTAKKKIIVPK